MPPRINDTATVEEILSMEPQKEQEKFITSLTRETAAVLLAPGPSRSIVDEQGNVLLCCGIIPFHANRYHAWTLLSVHASRHMPFIIKAMKGFIESLDCRRLEMTIREGFTAGIKWARILGFEPEGLMRAYGEDGGDFILYARIRQ